MTWRGVAESWVDLGQLDYLSDGGQSRIYRAPSYSLPDAPGPFVYKEYRRHLGYASGQSLARVISVRNSLGAADKRWLDAHAVWPLRIVVEGSTVTGVIMSLIPSEYFQYLTLPSGRIERVPREAQHLFIEPSRCHKYGLPYADLKQRLDLCIQFAAAIAFLHRRSVVFGDISPRNILFQLVPNTGLMLVDCDGAQKVGSVPAVAQANTPDWFPPEGLQTAQSIRTDRYKIGLFILRTLTPGSGSSVNRDPSILRNVIDTTSYNMLQSSLSPNPSIRPDAATWHCYLRSTRTDLLDRLENRTVGGRRS